MKNINNPINSTFKGGSCHTTMRYIFFILLAGGLIACNNSGSKSSASDAVNADSLKTKLTQKQNDGTPAVTSLCFLRAEGKAKHDSTSIELVLTGEKVTGLMNWLPYQKDSRKGSLNGTLKSDTITATWSFMQEGMKDTLNLKFLLKNNVLTQKPLKLNTKTGREQTDEQAAYSLIFNSSMLIHR